MAFENQPADLRIRQLPLSRSDKQLGFESRLRVWLYAMGTPGFALCWALLHSRNLDGVIQAILLSLYVLGWAFAVSVILEQILFPLQTLSNVVAALREDDYSF